VLEYPNRARVYMVFGLICKKYSKMPMHCMAHHNHQLDFFSTPTPIKDSVGDDGGEEACSAGRAADGATLFDLV